MTAGRGHHDGPAARVEAIRAQRTATAAGARPGCLTQAAVTRLLDKHGTIRAAAAALQVWHTTLARSMNGSTRPQHALVMAIAEDLGMRPEDVVVPQPQRGGARRG